MSELAHIAVGCRSWLQEFAASAFSGSPYDLLALDASADGRGWSAGIPQTAAATHPSTTYYVAGVQELQAALPRYQAQQGALRAAADTSKLPYMRLGYARHAQWATGTGSDCCAESDQVGFF